MRHTAIFVGLVSLGVGCNGTVGQLPDPDGSGGDHVQPSDAVAAGDEVDPGDAGGLGDPSSSSLANECANPRAEWIWCDDFEVDRTASYFEGSLTPAAGVGVAGSAGAVCRFTAGNQGAGGLKVAFGRTPQGYFSPVDAGTQDYREIYWRMFVRNESTWIGGGGDKLSRATIFASGSSWAQAMIAHVWSGGPNNEYLGIDPASGTDTAGTLQTTQYNDFDNLRWLGWQAGTTPLFASTHVGNWYCVEAHVRLNDAGSSNGVFELWIDGNLQAQHTSLNWVGAYNTYGINAVLFENYWNAGSPVDQNRYFDNLVVSTQRIDCGP